MGMLCDYFVAPSDEAAAATLDDGPQGLPAVSGEGIEPTVKIGTLEELLTGRPFDDILADSDELVTAVRDEGARIVSRLSLNVTTALAAASDLRLAKVAVPWSQTEEFWGDGDPEYLREFLLELRRLARLAIDSAEYLYCWVCM